MAKTLTEAVAAFTSNGVPAAQWHFKDNQPPPPPYAIARHLQSRNMLADDRAYRVFVEYVITLYVEDRDLDLEFAIEDALTGAEIVWTKQGGQGEDDLLVTTTYEFEVYER